MNNTLVTISFNVNNPTGQFGIKSYRVCADRVSDKYIYYYSYGSNHSIHHKPISLLNRIIRQKPQYYQYSFLTDAVSYNDIKGLKATQDAIERIYNKAENDIGIYCQNLLTAQKKL